jgi:site-specific recombinase XerD
MQGQQERMLDQLIEEFQQHLWRTRGTHTVVRHNYGRYVRTFLEGIFGDGPVDATRPTASHVIHFISSLKCRYRPSTMKIAGTALRAFFRFLQMEGVRDDRLDDAVPSVVDRRLAGLPGTSTKSSLSTSSPHSTAPHRGRAGTARSFCVWPGSGCEPGK